MKYPNDIPTPPVDSKGAESPIEQFAEEHLGIKLFPLQVEMIRNWADNKTIIRARSIGLSTANKVIREYIKANIKTAPRKANK